MNIIKRLEFDGFCVRSTAAIALLAGITGLAALLSGTDTAAVRYFAAFAGALAACGMITLYSVMAARAVCRASFAERAVSNNNHTRIASATFLIADAAASAVKLLLVLTPLTAGEGALPLRIAVLLADMVLSRLYMLFVTN